MPAKGTKGIKLTAEHRQNISKALLGMPRAIERARAAKISAALKGRKRPPELVAKSAAAIRGVPTSESHKAKSHAANVANGQYRPLGAEFVDKCGYVWVKIAHRAGTWNDNWKAKHRLVMETSIGRKLVSKEHVHHIDDNPANNRLENLLLLHCTQHCRLNYILRLLRIGGPELCMALKLTLDARGITLQ